MTTKRKAILLTLGAVLLVTVSVLTTIAYLTSTDEVKNTFTVGNVQIKLDEAKVNTDGTVVEGADRVKENKYHLLPGHKYVKDPTVTIQDDSENAYVRMLVDFKNIGDNLNLIIDEVNGKIQVMADNKEILVLTDYNTGWKMHDNPKNNVQEFHYDGTMEAGESSHLFKGFTLSSGLNNDDLTNLVDGENPFKINITAQAIQAEGLSVDEAWGKLSEELGVGSQEG